MKYLLIYLIIINLALFLAMGSDKRRARLNKRRIPEARLFLLAFLGGALGGWLGMYAFRHKTRRWYFKWGFPLIAAAQLAFIIEAVIEGSVSIVGAEPLFCAY